MVWPSLAANETNSPVGLDLWTGLVDCTGGMTPKVILHFLMKLTLQWCSVETLQPSLATVIHGLEQFTRPTSMQSSKVFSCHYTIIV